MIKVTEMGTRPNSTVPWNKILTQDIIDIHLEYISAKKLLGRYQIINNQENTNDAIQIWNTQESYDEYLRDSRLETWRESMKKYRIDNNIIITRYTVENVNENDPVVIKLLNKFVIKNENDQDVPLEDFFK